MNLTKLFALVCITLLVAVMLGIALNNYQFPITNSALADFSTNQRTNERTSNAPTTALKNYLPIIFLNSATAGGAWLLAGNAGTNPANDFLGTLDAQPLVMKTNNTEALRIDTNQNIGIGTITPTVKLTLQGNELIKGEDTPIARGTTITNLNFPSSVYVAGKYAYVASPGNGNLAIFDVSNPSTIVAKGFTFTNLNNPYSVYVSGKYAYVASTGNSRLAIFDVSDPNTIAAKGTITTNLNQPISVYVSGKYAYVASQTNNALAIFDVSDPNTIVAKGFITTNLSFPVSVYVAGKYAYVTSRNNNALALFDVSDPNTIAAKGTITTNLSAPSSVYVSGKYAYVASTGNSTLAIFDVSDSNTIVAKGTTITNLLNPSSVYVSGKYAYVTSRNNSTLALFDVSDPNTVVAKGFTTTNLNNPLSVYVSGKYAYVASGDNNALALFEVNNLEAPTLATGNLSSGGLDVTDNAIVGNNLYVQGGLNVGPGNTMLDGELAVTGVVSDSSLRIVNGYLQIPTVTNAPPSSECNTASHAGRMIIRTSPAWLYLCLGATGWITK